MKNNLNNKFADIISFFLFILPATIIAGPFLINLNIAIISTIFFFFCLLKKDWFLYKNIFIKILIIFLIFIIIRSFFSEYLLFSLSSSIFYTRYIFFSVAILFVLKFNKKFFEKFSIIFIITISILIFDGFYQYIYGVDLMGYNLVEMNTPTGRLSAFFGKELILGSFLSKISFLLTAVIIMSEFKYKEFIKNFFLILSILLTLISGDRTAFVLFCIGYFLYTLFYIDTFRMKIILITLSLISCAFLIGKDEIIYNRFIKQSYNQILYKNLEQNKETAVISEKKSYNIFSNAHQSHYIAAYKMFKDNIFFGHGTNTFRFVCREKYNDNFQSCTTHPHNYTLQLLSETGIVGGIILVSLFFFTIGKLIYERINYNKKYNKSYNFFILTSISLIINIFPFLPSGNFFGSSSANMVFLSFGFYLYALKKLKVNA